MLTNMKYSICDCAFPFCRLSAGDGHCTSVGFLTVDTGILILIFWYWEPSFKILGCAFPQKETQIIIISLIACNEHSKICSHLFTFLIPYFFMLSGKRWHIYRQELWQNLVRNWIFTCVPKYFNVLNVLSDSRWYLGC